MDTRSLAVKTLQNILNKNTAPEQDFSGLSPQELAFIKNLTQTALRKLEFVKFCINKYSNKKITQTLSQTNIITILGTVEILYFNTPDYATVNSYVEVAKNLEDKFIANFVNAILRKICRDKEALLEHKKANFFPKSFLKLLLSDYNESKVRSIEEASLVEPALDLTAKENPEEWAKTLEGALMPNGSIRINRAGAIAALEGYNQGAWWVQDLASSLAVQALGDIKGKRVLDLCAAPGGKTAQLINNGATVLALDISESRLNRLRENLARLNLSAQDTICQDAMEYLKQTEEDFDIILIDAPCSATGTLRRHPEIVHTRSEEDVRKNAITQKQMLELAAQKISKDGILLYAVCSLSKREGESQIKNFIEKHPDFTIIPITLESKELDELITKQGYIRCLPDMLEKFGGLDGFFVAKLQRIK